MNLFDSYSLVTNLPLKVKIEFLRLIYVFFHGNNEISLSDVKDLDFVA